jgi:hypothetical protein
LALLGFFSALLVRLDIVISRVYGPVVIKTGAVLRQARAGCLDQEVVNGGGSHEAVL